MITLDLDALNLAEGDRVLDLGCGRGRHLHGLHLQPQALDIVGLDLDLADLLAGREGFSELPPAPAEDGRAAHFTVGNAENLPFADASFNAVICSEVLEHVQDVEATLSEIDRVLAPGGRFALSVPRWWPEKICWALSKDYPATPGGHLRIFRDHELRRAIEARGYAFERRHWAHALHSPYWWLRCAKWSRQEDSRMVAAYRRLLEWDLLSRPRATRWAEAALNPVLGKSVALYFTKAVS